MYQQPYHRQRRLTALTTTRRYWSFSNWSFSNWSFSNWLFTNSSFANWSLANVLFAALLLASFAGKPVQADQDVDLNSCVSTADNQIEVEEDEAGNPAPSPACLSAVVGSEINWQHRTNKDFKIKFVKHSGGQCNDSADDDGKENDSKKGKLKKKGPNRAGCFHYRIKFKGGEWIDPVIVIRPN